MDGEETSGNDSLDSGPTIISDESDNNVSGDAIPVIEPETIVIEPEPGEQRDRKRGKRGQPSSSKPSGNKSSTKAADLGDLLLSIHFMLSKCMQIPELELDEEESAKLAKSMKRVGDLYGGMVVPEKILAWGDLAASLGTVYGPRFVAYNLRKKKEKPQQGPVTIDGLSGKRVG
jgi:hypothetical protein